MADDEALAALHSTLSARDYNRTKAGLGSSSDGADQATSVAQHYNSLSDRHRTLSSGSNILHLRNLNNFVKSVLFQKHLPRGDRKRGGAAVLDLACGKGGDMLKFKASDVAVYVGIDIAARSVQDGIHRYNGANGRREMPFQGTFMAGDFCASSIESKLPDGVRFHLVSCQFAMHYAFQSEARAVSLLRNAACKLRVGGTFVATIPDANVLVKRLRASEGLRFGNSLYSVEFAEAATPKSFTSSPFGLAYRFSLTEAVEDCEEYLVHLPTLTRLAAAAGLELIYAKNFTDFFAEEWQSHRGLLERMRVLPEEGSISQEEWDVAHVYMAVAFRRVRRPEDGDDVARADAQIGELVRNRGFRRLDPDRDLVYLDGAPTVPPASAESSAGSKRPREDEGETRDHVKYAAAHEDALFE